MEIILLVVPVGLAFGIPFAASRHDTFGRVLIALLLIVGTALTLDGIALAADFHDADGFIDCWPYCSTWQDIVGGTFWWGGMLFLVLVIAAIVSAARSSCAANRASRPSKPPGCGSSRHTALARRSY